MGSGDGGVLVFVGMVVVMMMAGIELRMVGNDVEVSCPYSLCHTAGSAVWTWLGSFPGKL